MSSSPACLELALPGGRVAFSTRQGGVSRGPYESLNLGVLTDDEPARVAENHARLGRALGLDPGRIATSRQVHGAEVIEWAGPPTPAPLTEADGHTTEQPGLGLLVLAADCLPIALVAEDRVAMLHGGWRGLAGGVLERGLARFGEPPAAAIGPGIGPCCYEVGPEVLSAFAHLPGVASGSMLDLKAVARCLLERAGVERVEDVDLCTSCRGDLFFSHRRDLGVTGRQGGLVWRTP